MKNFSINFAKLLLITISFFIVSIHSAQAATYTRYVDNGITDTNANSATPDCTNYSPTAGTCSGGSDSAYRSLRDVNAFINSMTNGTDSATIYFKRGGTWMFTSNSDSLIVNKSNVTFDVFGSGAKPILDGNNTYPTGLIVGSEYDIPYGFAIYIFGTSPANTVSNVHIKNLNIKNMYPGGGIIFNGKNSEGNYTTGPCSVEYCDIDTVGWAALYIYGIQNNSGSSGAVKLEHNSVVKAGEYSRITGQFLWPNGVGGSGGSYGHEVRYNTISDCYTEGIGSVFSIVEYNMIYNTKSGSIYINGDLAQTIARYNLVWGQYGGSYQNQAAGLSLDDEGQEGSNADSDIQIYGNVVVGCSTGISLRNNPLDGSGWSAWGSVKVYNNTLIDNATNIQAAYSNRYTHAEVKNNASIINTDSASVCQHIDHWTASEEAESWVNWTFGPNFYYGDGATSNSSLETPFQHANNVFGTDAPLPKTSGWRNLTSLNDFSFSDFYPATNSELVNRSQAAVISGFDQYLTTGTNWETLPDNEDFVLADQDSQGADWDFGAIINQQSGGDITSPTAPSGLSVE